MIVGRHSFTQLSPGLVLGAWVAALIAFVTLAVPWIFVASGLALALASFADPVRLLRLLRRSRWLLTGIVVMFGWLTPGAAVSWLPGATQDGVALGADQAARILLCLAMVSLLLGRTDPVTLVTGLHGLVRPLTALGLEPDRLAVRLFLILELLHERSDGVARPAPSLGLPRHRWTATDSVVLLAVLACLGLRFA